MKQRIALNRCGRILEDISSWYGTDLDPAVDLVSSGVIDVLRCIRKGDSDALLDAAMDLLGSYYKDFVKARSEYRCDP